MNQKLLCILLLSISVAFFFGTSISANSINNWNNMGVGSGVKMGDTVTLTYVCSFDDGVIYDSVGLDEPFILNLGIGGALPEFEYQIIGMTIGETKKFQLSSDQTYGDYDPSLIVDMPISFVPADAIDSVREGDIVTLYDGNAFFKAKVLKITEDKIKFDCNNLLAGKNLNYEVTLLDIE